MALEETITPEDPGTLTSPAQSPVKRDKPQGTGGGLRIGAVAVVAMLAGSLCISMLVGMVGSFWETAAALGSFLLPLLWATTSAMGSGRRAAREGQAFEEASTNARGHIQAHAIKAPTLTLENATEEAFITSAAVLRAKVSLSALRMVQYLLVEARGYRFPPISDTVDIFLADFRDLAAQLKTPQMVAVRVGILGTFVGLIISLESMKAISLTGGTLHGADEAVRQMLRGLAAAFGTSVGGLGASLVIQLYIGLLNRDIGLLAIRLKDAVESVTHSLAQAATGSELARSMDILHKSNLELADHLRAHKFSVEKTVDGAVDQIKEQAVLMGEGAKAFSRTDDVFKRAAEMHREQCDLLERTVAGIREVEERFEKVFADQNARVDAAAVEAQKKAREDLAAGFEAVGQTLQATLKELAEGSVSLAKGAAELGQVAAALQAERASAQVPVPGNDQARPTGGVRRVAAWGGAIISQALAIALAGALILGALAADATWHLLPN